MDISGVEVVRIKKNGQTRIQVEQDGFVVASNLTQEQAEQLAAKLIVQHQNRSTK